MSKPLLNELDSILREAIEALDNGKKVNGLEWASNLIKIALEEEK